MSLARPSWRGDLFVANLLVALAASQLALREGYHQVGGQSVNLALLLAWWLGLLLVIGVARGAVRDEARRLLVGRVVLLVAGGVAAHFVVGGSLLASVRGKLVSAAWWVVAGAVLVWIAWRLLRLDGRPWARLRNLLAVAGLLFVASQPVLTALLVSDVRWPAAAVGADKPVARSATFFILFDELNASASAGLADVLRTHGLQVSQQAVRSVGSGTAQVIPAMFTGRNFAQARPCGWTTICSGSNVLDFSRVHAARDDIDVIGFYHPYCAIQGLRWCRRVDIPLSLADADRWRCALWYRTGLSLGASTDGCNAVYARGPNELTRSILDALNQAPVWKEGGLVYVHIPLPHPPAPGGGVTLGEDYRGNIRRAEQLLSDLVVRARRAGLEELRVVVFSDHPLRQATWCRIYAPYSRKGCVIDPALSDERVPIIVGSTRAERLELKDNSEIFKLASPPATASP